MSPKEYYRRIKLNRKPRDTDKNTEVDTFPVSLAPCKTEESLSGIVSDNQPVADTLTPILFHGTTSMSLRLSVSFLQLKAGIFAFCLSIHMTTLQALYMSIVM